MKTYYQSLQIWEIKTAKVVHTIDLESPIVSIRYHTENDLLAVVCDDLGIRVIDLETKKVVREFWGHRNRITDFVSRHRVRTEKPSAHIFHVDIQP